MSKKGDKETLSNHNSSVQLLSCLCELEVTLFHKLFCITTKYLEEKICVSKYKSKKIINKIEFTLWIARKLASSGVKKV